MNKVSVYIITYNQIKKIEPAIKSVLWVNEIVVVDSHSTDGTTELAEKLGARVVQVPFQGFGDLRNRAIAACRYDWIFNLDSDERCTSNVRDEVLSVINSKESLDIYKIPRKNYFMRRRIKYCGWYPDYRQPQLFRKGSVSYFNDIVHENYQCHSKKPVGYLTNAIWQVPFQDLSEMMQKANRYSTLGVSRLKERYRKASVSLTLIHTAWTFIKVYILRRGFLDGWPGFVIAMGESYGAFYRYAKFYEKQKSNWKILESVNRKH